MNLFAEYRISSPYGGRLDPLGERGDEFHRGIDLVKPFQSPVYAFVSGVVLHASMGQAGTGFGNYGNVVAIRDKNGYLHCYCHLDFCAVKVGQQVDGGQMIGRLGNTGRSTGPHLHYEVRSKCEPSFGWQTDVDPTVYLENYYKEESNVPVITKERIVAENGKLKYIPLTAGAYSVKATDVRLLKLELSKIRMKLVARKGGKVSALTKEFNADFGFNFPFFDADHQVPTGTVWDGSQFINGAWGPVVDWYKFAVKDHVAVIDKPGNERNFELSVQGKILIENGKMVWKNDGQRCQRTAVGLDGKGNLYVLIADGRTGSDQGLTCEEMALYFADKGCIWALEGDGGGSTILYSKTGGVCPPYNLKYDAGSLNQSLNTGANERVVHHAMLVFIDDAAYKDSDVIKYGDLKKLGLIK